MLDKPDAAQTEIRVGLAGIPRNDPEYFQVRVANAVFGGLPFASRLGQELRVKRGLTYGAGSSFDTRRLAGAFQIATNTKTDTTAEALQVIMDELTRIRTNDVPAEELKARKDFVAGAYSLTLETPDAVAGRLLDLELYGLPKTTISDYTKNVGAVTAADVRKVFETRVRPEQLVVVLAGNASAFVDKLKPFGTVERIPFDAVDPSSDTLQRAAAQPAQPAGAGAGATDGKAAEALANRTIDALGGAAFVGQKSQVAKGSGELSPAPGQTIPIPAMTEYRLFPNRTRADWDAGAMVIRRGYNGTAGWADQPGQGIVDATSQFKQNEHYGINILRRFRAGGVTVRPVADAELNGAKLKGFALADAEGHETTFYVDATTFLPVKYSFTLPQGERTTLVSDYRDVSGVKIPFKAETQVNGATFLVATYTDVQVNVDVDPALFERPTN